MAGKRIENAYKTIDKSKLYSLKDAVKLVKPRALLQKLLKKPVPISSVPKT